MTSKILNNQHPLLILQKETRYILRNYKLDVYYSVLGDIRQRRYATELTGLDYLMLPQSIKNRFEVVEI
jgi:hypothetical protein